MPDEAPLQTVRFTPRQSNRMASVLAMTLLEALGRSIGLKASADPRRNTSTTRQTVSRLPRLELTTTPAASPGSSPARGASSSASVAAPSAMSVAVSW